MPTHHYSTRLDWTGNRGSGTSGYRDYARDHTITAPGRPALLGSSDPLFRGDATRYNPEQLLVAALSSCHMLWFLHLAAEAKVVVTAYQDDAVGTMNETSDGGGYFTQVVLRPAVTISGSAPDQQLTELHHRAHELCFIANSVKFPVRCEQGPVTRA